MVNTDVEILVVGGASCDTCYRYIEYVNVDVNTVTEIVLDCEIRHHTLQVPDLLPEDIHDICEIDYNLVNKYLRRNNVEVKLKPNKQNDIKRTHLNRRMMHCNTFR